MIEIVIAGVEDERLKNLVTITLLVQEGTGVGVQVLAHENQHELVPYHQNIVERVQAPGQRSHVEPVQGRQVIIKEADLLRYGTIGLLLLIAVGGPDLELQREKTVLAVKSM